MDNPTQYVCVPDDYQQSPFIIHSQEELILKYNANPHDEYYQLGDAVQVHTTVKVISKGATPPAFRGGEAT